MVKLGAEYRDVEYLKLRILVNYQTPKGADYRQAPFGIFYTVLLNGRIIVRPTWTIVHEWCLTP